MIHVLLPSTEFRSETELLICIGMTKCNISSSFKWFPLLKPISYLTNPDWCCLPCIYWITIEKWSLVLSRSHWLWLESLIAISLDCNVFYLNSTYPLESIICDKLLWKKCARIKDNFIHFQLNFTALVNAKWFFRSRNIKSDWKIKKRNYIYVNTKLKRSMSLFVLFLENLFV